MEQDKLHATLTDIASSFGLTLELSAGRRAGDVTLMHLKGDREQSMPFYKRVSESYPDFEVQLFNIPDSPDFGMIAVLLDPNSQKRLPVAVEHRTNLHLDKVYY